MPSATLGIGTSKNEPGPAILFSLQQGHFSIEPSANNLKSPFAFLRKPPSQ